MTTEKQEGSKASRRKKGAKRTPATTRVSAAFALSKAQFYILVMDQNSHDPESWGFSNEDPSAQVLLELQRYDDPPKPLSRREYVAVSEKRLAAPIASRQDIISLPQGGTVYGLVRV